MLFLSEYWNTCKSYQHTEIVSPSSLSHNCLCNIGGYWASSAWGGTSTARSWGRQPCSWSWTWLSWSQPPCWGFHVACVRGEDILGPMGDLLHLIWCWQVFQFSFFHEMEHTWSLIKLGLDQYWTQDYVLHHILHRYRAFSVVSFCLGLYYKYLLGHMCSLPASTAQPLGAKGKYKNLLFWNRGIYSVQNFLTPPILGVIHCSEFHEDCPEFAIISCN